MNKEHKCKRSRPNIKTTENREGVNFENRKKFVGGNIGICRSIWGRRGKANEQRHEHLWKHGAVFVSGMLLQKLTGFEKGC